MIRVIALVAFFFSGCTGVCAQTSKLTVFAAASLQGVIEEAAKGFEADLVFSYGGSGAIARQIAQGAPADLVVLASPLWMDWLVTSGLTSAAAVQVLAENRLVVVAPAGSEEIAGPPDIKPRLGAGRLAMGQRDAVPAGIYAREWLESAGVWASVKDQLAEVDNVRAALALVARGETPLGIVYATDAGAEPAVDVVFNVPSQYHSAIRYPATALTPEGQRLLAHLQQPDAVAVFAAYGFRPVHK